MNAGLWTLLVLILSPAYLFIGFDHLPAGFAEPLPMLAPMRRQRLCTIQFLPQL